jgi:hypothetical protein
LDIGLVSRGRGVDEIDELQVASMTPDFHVKFTVFFQWLDLNQCLGGIC